MKSVSKYFLILAFLICGGPAMGGHFEIETGPGWMNARADGVPLERVLTQVAQKIDCAVYLDEELQNAPVSFVLEEKMVFEKAIRPLASEFMVSTARRMICRAWSVSASVMTGDSINRITWGAFPE